MVLSPSEEWRLNSFRRAAAKVREATIIAQGKQIELNAVAGDPGYVDILIKLLEDEPFRSLALSVRLAYQQGEPSHYYSVCKLLFREGDEPLKQRVAELRSQYQGALAAPENTVTADDNGRIVAFSAQQVFDYWLYGMVFHQDENRQEALRLLLAEGPRFLWSVQSTVLQLAGRIMDLDDVVADFLGEARLERI